MSVLKWINSGHNCKMFKLKDLLFGICTLILTSSCQRQQSDSVVLSPQVAVETTPPLKRYDQSVVAYIDTNIKTQASNNRSLPMAYAGQANYCESVNGDQNQFNSTDVILSTQQKYPLASVSKLFLTAWALNVLGPEFKFTSEWYFKKLNDGRYDVYFHANYDPVLNIEKMLYMISVLQSKGITQIRQLVIDESTRVFLSVLNNPHYESTETPVGMTQSVQNLKTILNSSNWGQQTAQARQNLQSYFFQKKQSIQVAQKFQLENAIYIEKSKINLSEYSDKIIFPSVSLKKYLKEINVESNNYISDSLFSVLGGSQKFKKFQTEVLKISESELSILTGSGLPIDQFGIAANNYGTCLSVLKVLKFNHLLAEQLNVNLGSILLNAGLDKGTFESNQPLNFQSNVVLKTGRLMNVPALNVAGIVSLKNKNSLYFAFLGHDFDFSDEEKIKNHRDSYIQSLLKFYPTTPDYKSTTLDQIFF